MISQATEQLINRIYNACPFKKDVLKNKTILITGASGLIGSTVLRFLDCINKRDHLNIKIIGIARNKDKVKRLGLSGMCTWMFQDISVPIITNCCVDYILHTACATDSLFFTTNPVEVINCTINGTNSILQLAKEKKSQRVVFTSSLEIYGNCLADTFIEENEYFPLDYLKPRNCYPESKRMAECLCASYAHENAVPVCIARLGQVFGPGVQYSDQRVFAQFARAINEKEDIVLTTRGETRRSYCSLLDATIGLLILMIYGVPGEAYNIASDNSFISILELADLFTQDTKSKIIIQEQNDSRYLNTVKFGLATEKIKKLGFHSFEGIEQMVADLKADFKNYTMTSE